MKIGFDIGGSKTEICAISRKGILLFQHRTYTPSSYSELLTLIDKLTKLAKEKTKKPTQSIGIGLPGSLSKKNQLIKNSNLLYLNGQDLKSDLEALLDGQVHIANDANCFTLSEATDGAANTGKVVFGAILGTGCGGGLVIDKKLLVGVNAISGEWGHNPLPGYFPEYDGPERLCYCGRKNCIEQFISGRGLELSYKQVTGKVLSAKALMQSLPHNTNAKKCYTRLIDQMARSFASIINTLDPDTIVIGGGLSNINSLYKDLPNAMLPYIFSDSVDTKIVQAKFGDSSGVRRAAWLNEV
ncbi:ROK family protein [Marinomonas sp. C2222]|uniref:ROK family protein n=1 Tax=Marinomonas sargassi TaxID=2984494 RepID=A0ABT2YPS2_9GAMM|nr:ROK family protein [Marinomonas sargassi]MCV2401893.1 ROK family protein [Marinomonas sargassi]